MSLTDPSLNGHIALVIGASSGIGLHLAQLFARAGASVAIAIDGGQLVGSL